MRLARIAVIGLLAAVTVGCAGSVPGTATPTATPGSPPLPPRPRELRVDDLDPCTALTAAQLKVLGVSFYAVNAPDADNGPGCYWIHSPDEPVESYTIGRNIGFHIEEAFGNSRGAAVTTVAGFPAVETQDFRAPDDASCIVLVNVADLQEIQSTYFYSGSTVPMTRDLACQKAKTAAEMAMQTILARAGG